MHNKRILISGGTKGIGKELVELYSGRAVGIGRSTGHDIDDPCTRSKIAAMSLGFDVFLNHAYSPHSFSQVLLLEEVFELWKSKSKQGMILSTGSYHTYSRPQQISHYLALKIALDEYSRQCAKWLEDNSAPFRVSIIRPGTLNTKRSREKATWNGKGISAESFALVLNFLVESPTDVILPEIVISSRKSLCLEN